jgi:hypothetical protein
MPKKSQKIALDEERDPDWLFNQCRRIADALNKSEIALAQIYGVRIPIDCLDDRQLRRLAHAGHLAKAGFNPGEPRVPRGSLGGGEWTNGDAEAGSPDDTPSAGAAETPVDALSGETGSARVPALGLGESESPPADAGSAAAASGPLTDSGGKTSPPSSDQVADVPLEPTKNNCIAYCYERTEGPQRSFRRPVLGVPSGLSGPLAESFISRI